MMVDYITYFLLFFMLMRSLVALLNLVTKQWLPVKGFSHTPLVSVLVPFRNEESNIPILVESIINQDYKNIELIMYNDCSTDNSLQLVHEFSSKFSFIKVIDGQNLPVGWLGKNHACYQLAQVATGEYFLFIDADVKIRDGLIQNLLFFLNKKKLSLLSVFPKQIMLTKAELGTVPLMNSILLGLLPLFMIRLSGWTSFSAANGQCMFFRAADYKKHQFHSTVRNNKVEDIAIVKTMKKLKLKVHTLCSNGNIECRMYTNYTEAVNGFAKNIMAFFGNNNFFMGLYCLLTSFSLLYLIVFSHIIFIVSYILLFLIFKLAVSVISRQNFLQNLTYSFHQQVNLIVICLKAIVNMINKNNYWKGRKIG